MKKMFFETLEDILGFISIVCGLSATIYSVASWGVFTVILVGICAYILYWGVHITRKLIDKEDD